MGSITSGLFVAFAAGLMAVPAGAGEYAGLWLRVSDEVAVPGGSVQVRLTLTEPKPIIRSRLVLEFDENMIEEITTLSIHSDNGEAVGTATRRGNRIYVETTSPQGRWGNTEELPLATMQIKLRAGVPPGSESVIRILKESTFEEPDGDEWEVEDNQPGVLVAGERLAVEDVYPSGGFISEGQAVRVRGQGFKPWSRVYVGGLRGLAVKYVSPTELQFQSDRDFQLDERELRVVNPDASEARYLPALRGKEVTPSLYDHLLATRPMFSSQTAKKGEWRISAEPVGVGHFLAVSLQNPYSRVVGVHYRILDSERETLASGTFTLSNHERVSRDLDEMLGGKAQRRAAVLILESSDPVQMLGLAGNLQTDVVMPVAISRPD